MHKLNAALLVELGAPQRAGAQQIEEWLRGLLRGGTLRLPVGLVELRGSQPVTTTLGDLKRACGVAMETVKQGLRALEMEHWIMAVDGVHTRLLGPPRFRVSVTKENISGSVGRAIEVAPMDGLNPLESIEYDALRRADKVQSRKRLLAAQKVSLNWKAHLRLANGEERELARDTELTLAAGSHARLNGRLATLAHDLEVQTLGGREVRTNRATQLLLDDGEELAARAAARLQLERANVIRLSTGQTGLLEVRPHVPLDDSEEVSWDRDSEWLARFTEDGPLVFVRRVVFAELHGVVDDACQGVGPMPAEVWRVVLGVHDCFLDGSIPFRAGKCSARRSADRMLEFVYGFAETDSLRERMEAEFGFRVDAADVRLSPTIFATPALRALLRKVAADPALNAELLSVANKAPCWTQTGAYYRQGDVAPWEITREVYFTFVDVSYRQSA